MKPPLTTAPPFESTPELLSSPVITVADAARVSRLSKSDVYNRVRSGELESVRVGRRVLIKTASLKRLLDIDGPTGSDAA